MRSLAARSAVRFFSATCLVAYLLIGLELPNFHNACAEEGAATENEGALESALEGEGKLLVGLLVPETGADKERGEAMRNGATLAIEALNVAGGVHGAKMALSVVESSPDPQSIVKSFSALAGRAELPAVILSDEDDCVHFPKFSPACLYTTGCPFILTNP